MMEKIIKNWIHIDEDFIRRVIMEVAENWEGVALDQSNLCQFCSEWIDSNEKDENICNHKPDCIVPRCIELVKVMKENGNE